MGAQPDTSTSAPDVWHGIQQILAQIPVAAHLATYLGINFPRYTIRDMVRTEYELVTKGLGLSGLHAVAGPSMGSFQGVEWGINYPTFMKGLVLIVPAARSNQHFHAIVDAVEAMITLDPAYKDGKYDQN